MQIYNQFLIFNNLILQKISTNMKATPFLQELLHLAANLLQKNGHQEIANQIYQNYKLPEWVKNNNPLLKKGFTKIIKQYVRNNQKMLKYYENRKELQEIEAEQPVKKSKKNKSKQAIIQQEETPKIKSHRSPKNKPQLSPKQTEKTIQNSKSNWLSKFSEPKRLQQINHLPKQKQILISPPIQKQNIKKKRVQIQSSQYQSENDSFELEPKKKIKTEKIKEKIIQKQEKVKKICEAIKQKQQRQDVSEKQKVKPSSNQPKKFFSRINIQEIGQIKQELKDNSFQAKARFGQEADSWGQFGYDKLKDTRGQSFKKTKGKLKSRAFQGSLMDINKINSIPIL